MNTGKWRIVATLVSLAAAAIIPAGGCTSADAELLQGVLEQVDSVSGEVVVKLKDGGTVTINLEDVDVEALKAAVGSASLEPGDDVTVEVDKDKKPRKLKAHLVEVEGSISAIDKVAGKVTVVSEDGGNVTVSVTDDTKIEAEEDEDLSANDLQESMTVEVKYDPSSMTAAKIEIDDEDDEDKDQDDEGRVREVKGTISSVDPVAKTITIRARNGHEKRYRVLPSTELELDGVGALADLKPGIPVEAKVSPKGDELIELEAED